MTTAFKIARLMLGKRQIDIANKTRLGLCTISFLENGRLIPNQNQLRKLRKALPNLDRVEAFTKAQGNEEQACSK